MTDSTMPSLQSVPIQNAEICYQTVGQGPAVTFIHAGIADLRMWDPQIEVFAGRYRVIRFDVRGYGRSTNPAGVYHDYEILRELLDHLGVESTALVGCSMGGDIAIDFALAYPKRVEALITVGSALDGFEGSDRAEITAGWAELDELYEAGELAQCAEIILRMWCDGPKRTPAQIDPEVRAQARVMALHLLQIPEALDLGEAEPLQPRALERLHELRTPVLAMVGDQDFENQIEFAHRLVEQAPNARLAIMNGVAHLPSMEQHDAFNRIVLDFLARGRGVEWSFGRVVAW